MYDPKLVILPKEDKQNLIDVGYHATKGLFGEQ